MESNFLKIRQELNELGYTETLKPDCVPLVKRLLADLKTTTDSLKKYVNLSKQALEERDTLQLGAEPYKCDNAKLIRECNELHLAFIQFKEQHEKVQKDLRIEINSLEAQLQNCELEKASLKKRITELEIQLRRSKKVDSQSHLLSTKEKTGKSKGFGLDSAMACADEKIAYMSKEMKNLKEEKLRLLENNAFLKTQIQNREEEINRLKNLLEGGRPLEAISKDCCYKNIDNKIGKLQDEINNLKRERNTLQNQLKEALAKQHEAMRRALHLADRNKQLENEMKDIDQIALAVEAECNNTVKDNSEKINRLQDRMNESLIMIQNLERENIKLKQDKLELNSDLDAIKLEKKHLQSLLDMEIDDKKRLTDRINSFTIIEHDLNMEIDRLVRLSGEQKRKIAELECQITDGKLRSSSFDLHRPAVTQTDEPDYISSKKLSDDRVKSLSKPRKFAQAEKSKPKQTKRLEHKITCKKSTTKSTQVTKEPDDVPSVITGQMGRCCCEAGSCVRHMKELLDKEMQYRQTQAMQQIESLKQEKDYYMKEFHRISDQMRNIPTHDKSDKLHQQYNDLLRKIEEKNQLILDLQNENKTLSTEKYSLISRLEGLQDQQDSELDGICQKPNCKRKVRELEIVREELKHLERENESLKVKIQSLNESTVFDQERMKKAFQEMEEHIRKLENERRGLVVEQCTSRSNLTQAEEECNLLREQLRTTQSELNVQRANYTQLKNLHDQTDRALSDAQSQILRAETELANLQSRMNSTHRETAGYEKEIARLQGDIQVMKSQLSKLDREKDELLNVVDEKTEKIASLEEQLNEKKNAISNLERELKELHRKLGKISDDVSKKEQLLRSSNQELTILQKDYDDEKRSKESAIQENRRLQSDLSSVTCDCRDARKELEIAKRQVEDLKRQLQHYVAEVKRTEDLISQKELERTEILDQFKCLSEEANILESNNHTLENEATQSRVQLSVALDHASDLERKVDNQDAIIRSYEKQIADLTSQVASLEIQMKHGDSQHDRVDTELKRLKDLCVRLDNEKDSLKRELNCREDQRGQVERNIDRLSRENDELRKTLSKDRNNFEGLEKLLNEARQEVIEQRLLNQDLQSEISRMKTKIDELQERLRSKSSDVETKAKSPKPKKSCCDLCKRSKAFLDSKTPTIKSNAASLDSPKTRKLHFDLKNNRTNLSANTDRTFYTKVHRIPKKTVDKEMKRCDCSNPTSPCVCEETKALPLSPKSYAARSDTSANESSSVEDASQRYDVVKRDESTQKSAMQTVGSYADFGVSPQTNKIIKRKDKTSLKNVLTVEIPGVEFSLSSYKTVESKSSSQASK